MSEAMLQPFAKIEHGKFGFARLQLGYRISEDRVYEDVFIVNKRYRTKKAKEFFDNWVDLFESYEAYIH